MTFPVYLRFGSVALHPHWVFESFAYSVAFYWYIRARRSAGDVVDRRVRRWVVAAAIVGGFVGSRLLYLLEDPVQLGSDWADPAFIFGGKTIVGGLIGGLIAVEAVKHRLGVRIATGDLFAVPLAVGIAIGRIGCFLSGLDDRTYGTATVLPWGVDFGDGILRHPTQLYEIGFLVMLGALITAAGRLKMTPGDQFKMFIVGYMTFRFAVDFLKPGPRLGGVSVLQWACLAVIAYYAPHVPRVAAEVRHG
jgi:phosphatidylglycerol---prolipoprotein diacylglyceryl transferase